jgi:uncharacterized protein
MSTIKYLFYLLLLYQAALILSGSPHIAVHARGLTPESRAEVHGSWGQPQEQLPVVRLRSGRTELEVEVARTFRERATGLMFRRDLPEGRGMIFVYSSDQVLGYWMKNTYLPLSIAYLCADGVIQEIFHMQPMSVETVFSSEPARFALEVPQGWFEKNGLKPGDRFDFPKGFP